MLAEILPLLARAADGARVHVVGGAVRDSLLGRPLGEVDVVVEDGAGMDVARRFAEIAGAPAPVVFERFGTAQVMWGQVPVEFVSARRESYLPESRKPEVEPGTLEDDLRRRDFTVNALVMELDGGVADPLGSGLPDLGRRLLRTPLEPEATFSDDPLRMVRAVRFAAQLGFQLDPAIPPAIAKMRGRLRPPIVSVERVTEELRKMLLSERPADALALLDSTGLLDVVLPEVAAGRGVGQGGWHRWDVLGHTIEAVRLAPPDLVIRLSALFHDVGKPPTAGPDGSFLGHENVGAELTESALSRLRFSNEVITRVSRLVKLHLRPVYYSADWTDGAVRRLVRAAGDDVDALLALARADVAASAYPDAAKLDELARRIDEVRAEAPSRLSPPISGDDLMRELGLSPGPQVGRVKAHLDALVLDGEVPADRAALLEFVRSNREELERVAGGED